MSLYFLCWKFNVINFIFVFYTQIQSPLVRESTITSILSTRRRDVARPNECSIGAAQEHAEETTAASQNVWSLAIYAWCVPMEGGTQQTCLLYGSVDAQSHAPANRRRIELSQILRHCGNLSIWVVLTGNCIKWNDGTLHYWKAGLYYVKCSPLYYVVCWDCFYLDTGIWKDTSNSM